MVRRVGGGVRTEGLTLSDRQHPIDRPRPSLHFTPPANWMNDPNGLVEVDGTYHLFYQHNPDGVGWGNLHWGHATSQDLLTWDHRPVAILPDEVGQAFSGSIVVDHDDTAGFGPGALVAAYTQHLDGLQRQSIAHSLDGDTWTPYPGNPVIEGSTDTADFRDPKVLRHTSPTGEWWTMVLAVGTEVWLYRSDDLRAWERTSTLAVPTPWPGAIVEVPELVAVPVEGSDELVWVLIVSFIPPAEPGRGTRSVPGRVRWLPVTFDGLRLAPRGDATDSLILDGGRDFYAAMAWAGDDERPPIVIGWMDERALGLDEEHLGWCGRQSLPRALSLVAAEDGPHLRQRPILDPAAAGLTVAAGDLADGAEITIDAPCLTVALEVSFDGTPADGHDSDGEGGGRDGDGRNGDGEGGARDGGGGHHGEVRLAIGSEEVLAIERTAVRLGDIEHPVPTTTGDSSPVARRVLVVIDAGSIEAIVDDGLGVVSNISAAGLASTTLRCESVGPAELLSARVRTVAAPTSSDTAGDA
ncbi:MAG: glycoside hydrolase family 32 protein [Actinomycetota bacterium]